MSPPLFPHFHPQALQSKKQSFLFLNFYMEKWIQNSLAGEKILFAGFEDNSFDVLSESLSSLGAEIRTVRNPEMLEKELARLKESVSVRQQHKKEIINRRLNELIGRDDYFEW